MIPLRIVLGLVKGLVVGGGLGAGLYALDPTGTTLTWLRWPLYGLVGLLTGIVCGKPPWAKGAWVASILKGLIGFGLCVGLYFLAQYLLRFDLLGREPTAWYFAFGGLLGVIYGVFVEVDDGGKGDKEAKKDEEKGGAAKGGEKPEAAAQKGNGKPADADET